ncbi:MAG: SufE family protein [Gammaproteobacteria bacterium]|nr:MAG: SufE family protein [Gammaproteobacteria bacterium]
MFKTDDLSSVSLSELIAASNWQAQYRFITQWGKLIHTKPELRVTENLLQGCEVSAWLAHREENGFHYFAFDSDSRVINGLAVLLLVQVNGKTTEEICAIDFAQILKDAGLEKHLTPTRNNGLQAIIGRVRKIVGA